jgi:hypothetical protein
MPLSNDAVVAALAPHQNDLVHAATHLDAPTRSPIEAALTGLSHQGLTPDQSAVTGLAQCCVEASKLVEMFLIHSTDAASAQVFEKMYNIPADEADDQRTLARERRQVCEELCMALGALYVESVDRLVRGGSPIRAAHRANILIDDAAARLADLGVPRVALANLAA